MTKRLAKKGRQIIAKKSREPLFGEKDDLNLKTMEIFHWYNNNKNKKDSRKYLIDYLKKNRVITTKELRLVMLSDENSVPLNLGWICRMSELNECFKIEDKISEYFHKHLQKAIQNGKRVQEERKREKKKNIKNVRDYVQENLTKVMALFEENIDEVVFYENTDSFDIKSFLIINNCKKIHVDKIIDYLNKNYAEMNLVQKGSEDYAEAYSHLSKRRINFLLKFYDELIKKCVEHLDTLQSTRKVRKKKQKTPDQIVKKVQYQNQCEELNIKSLSPEKLVHSEEVWIYNTKYKKLSHYIAKDPSGLSVKGTSLTNFSDESVEKTVRKPDEIIKDFDKIAKTKAKKLFDSLKTKESKCKGRLNQNSIILRVFK